MIVCFLIPIHRTSSNNSYFQDLILGVDFVFSFENKDFKKWTLLLSIHFGAVVVVIVVEFITTYAISAYHH